MLLRVATIDDAQRLFDWRNDPATRAASHQTSELEFSSHVEWLRLALISRRILIAEIDCAAVGTIRIDPGPVPELSWTVAPRYRRTGIGRQMVALAAKLFGPPMRAEIKRENVGSQKIASAAGFLCVSEFDGVLHYELRSLEI